LEAFTGNLVEEQLEKAAHGVLTSSEYVRIEEDRLLVTKILDWYGSDFVKPGYVGAEKNLLDYLSKYAQQDVREWIDSQPSSPKPKFMKYDWALNRAS
jgi:hypothetical protein